MAKRPRHAPKIKLRPGHTSPDLGRSAAEDDARLADYYIRKELYVDRALNVNDSASFFKGPKGVGKSAILQMVRLHMASDQAHVINLSPTELALSTFANLNVPSSFLKEADKHQWLYKSLWDYIILTEVGGREFPDESKLLGLVMSLIRGRDENRLRKLLRLRLDDNGNVETLSTRFVKLLKEVELSGVVGGEDVGKVEMKVKLDPAATAKSNQYDLLGTINDVSKRLADLLSQRYYLIIDDLDVDWHNEPVQNQVLAAMFTSLRKICRPPHLKCVVAIQDRILHELPVEHKDKFRDALCEVQWDAESVKLMIERRVTKIVEVTPSKVWGHLFPEGAFEWLFRKTTGKPREAIRLASLCLSEARRSGEATVNEAAMRASFQIFSAERLADIGAELSHLYPGIAKALRPFSGFPKEFPLTRVKDAMDAAIMQTLDDPALPYKWIASYERDYCGFARILLESGILQYKHSRTDPARTFDPAEHDLSAANCYVAFHPMYTAALGLIGA